MQTTPTTSTTSRPGTIDMAGSGMVTGLFRNRSAVERAYDDLKTRGYSDRDINVVMSDETRKQHFAGDGVETELGNKAAKGAGVGAGVGGTIGAVAAGIAAIGTSLVIPGLGLVVAGPLAAALAGAGAGGAAGGLVGALVGAGIPEERVKHYEKGMKEGGILLGVNAKSPDEAREIERSWKSAEGEHVYS